MENENIKQVLDIKTGEFLAYTPATAKKVYENLLGNRWTNNSFPRFYQVQDEIVLKSPSYFRVFNYLNQKREYNDRFQGVVQDMATTLGLSLKTVISALIWLDKRGFIIRWSWHPVSHILKSDFEVHPNLLAMNGKAGRKRSNKKYTASGDINKKDEKIRFELHRKALKNDSGEVGFNDN